MRPALLGLVLALSGRVLGVFPGVVEWHRVAAFPSVTAVLQGVSGSWRGTFGEGAALVLGGAAVIILAREGRRGVGPLLLAAGFVVLAFYLSFGLAYQYPALSSRLAAMPFRSGGGPAGRLSDLSEKSALLLAQAAQAALTALGSNADLMARINVGLTEGYLNLPERIDVAPVRRVVFGPTKASRVSFALSRLQLSGYYFPWTGEAQINVEMPRSLWARVAAHERAHQRGFARENEATVVGLLACLSSSEPAVFYGGALGLFVAFDREIARLESETRSRLWKILPARVVGDLRAETAFWKAHEGVAGAVSEKVNDTYLKAQGVRTGVGSYGETTRLILQAVDTEDLRLGRLLSAASVAK